jgi:large subunit ribosomal protein L18
MLKKEQLRQRRKSRIRAKISGTAERPRLAIDRSNTNIYAQLIDDTTGTTLASASDLKIKAGTKMERAKQVGEMIGKLALEKKIETCTFDRGGYRYHGRVRALADGAREAGLKF